MIVARFMSVMELPLKYFQNSITNNYPQLWDFRSSGHMNLSPLHTASGFLPKLSLLPTNPTTLAFNFFIHLHSEVVLK